MAEIEFEGTVYVVDEDGFIDDFNNWDPGWAKYCKTQEGIEEMTDEHLKVIDVLHNIDDDWDFFSATLDVTEWIDRRIVISYARK